MDHAPPSEDQRAAGRARSRWWRRTWLGRCRRPCPPALPPRLSVSSWSGRRHPGRRSRSSITAAGSSACAGSAASARASAGAYRAGPAGGTRPGPAASAGQGGAFAGADWVVAGARGSYRRLCHTGARAGPPRSV